MRTRFLTEGELGQDYMLQAVLRSREPPYFAGAEAVIFVKKRLQTR